MAYSRSEMVYHDYRWTARPEDNPNFRGGADHVEFNRKEGYEVLYTINKFMEKNGLSSTMAGQKAERLIHDELPSRTYTHSELWVWLKSKW